MSKPAAATVLVVDDDKNTCSTLSAVLADQGCEAVVAGNGKEALDYLRTSPRRPDLILLDLMMPEMTGWEFRRVQQEDPALAAIPVAIITGLTGQEDKAKDLGAVDVLKKPSTIETIASLVTRFCK